MQLSATAAVKQITRRGSTSPEEMLQFVPKRYKQAIHIPSVERIAGLPQPLAAHHFLYELFLRDVTARHVTFIFQAGKDIVRGDTVGFLLT